MNYDVNYFIKKFEAIPEGKWLVRSQGNNGNHCAVGHCKNVMGQYGNSGMMIEDQFSYSPEAVALAKLFYDAKIVGVTFDYLGWNVADVNNGDHPDYQQPTPKQRILAALYDIKNMQEPQHTDITKQLAVLPVNETSDLITTNILQ